MFKKFAIATAIILGYFLIPSLLIILFKSIMADEVMLGIVCALFIGFVPLIWIVGRRIFLFKAQHNQAIAQADLVAKLSNINLEDCELTVEQLEDSIILSPPYISDHYGSVFREHRITHAYYLRLWFDESKQLVCFKDYVCDADSVLGVLDFSYDVKVQSGFVMTTFSLLDSHGELQSFNNSELHKQLVELVTGNGWDLRLRFL